jgi:hypothetical protein
MIDEIQIEDSESAKSAELKLSIQFFMSHLSVKELRVLMETAKSLAKNYSQSYHEWLYK